METKLVSPNAKQRKHLNAVFQQLQEVFSSLSTKQLTKLFQSDKYIHHYFLFPPAKELFALLNQAMKEGAKATRNFLTRYRKRSETVTEVKMFICYFQQRPVPECSVETMKSLFTDDDKKDGQTVLVRLEVPYFEDNSATQQLWVPNPFRANVCSSCKVSHKSKLRKCQKCGGPRYCNETCQKKHWNWHKALCLKLSK
jgi:hypothetical protein